MSNVVLSKNICKNPSVGSAFFHSCFTSPYVSLYAFLSTFLKTAETDTYLFLVLHRYQSFRKDSSLEVPVFLRVFIIYPFVNYRIAHLLYFVNSFVIKIIKFFIYLI